jgi:hypothetical protein
MGEGVGVGGWGEGGGVGEGGGGGGNIPPGPISRPYNSHSIEVSRCGRSWKNIHKGQKNSGKQLHHKTEVNEAFAYEHKGTVA